MNKARAPGAWGGLVLWLGITFVAAAIGALASRNADSFYGELVQPEWAPPASLFGPVWSVLYLLMGIAAWLVWRERRFLQADVTLALGFFVAQLVLNSLWSWLFFAWHDGALAFADIGVLWVLIVVTLVLFWRVRRLAGVLLLPYLIWVSFAAALNFSTWRMNPGLLG
jgi:benzodiazapine receptor